MSLGGPKLVRQPVQRRGQPAAEHKQAGKPLSQQHSKDVTSAAIISSEDNKQLDLLVDEDTVGKARRELGKCSFFVSLEDEVLVKANTTGESRDTRIRRCCTTSPSGRFWQT